MSRAEFISLERAASLISDSATITVSSSSGLGCPDATLRAIGQRFEQNGHPKNLTTLHPIAAGDMYGILGIDHLAEPGLLKCVISGSLPSGPSSLPTPKIWKMIEEDQIEAFNLPSGVLFHMHREAAAGRPGVLTKVGLDTFVDPRRHGGKMNSFTKREIVEVVQFDGQEWLYYRSITPDVAIIRGTTADEHGNISMEHEGAFLGVVDQALAARNSGGIVVAQVKRLAATGNTRPQSVRVPGILVDYIVVDPEQKQTTQTQYDPALWRSSVRRPPFKRSNEPDGDRQARRNGTVQGRCGQSRVRYFGSSAPYTARRRAARYGDLGDRTRCGGRDAAAWVRIRMCGQRGSYHAVARPVYLFSGCRV